ncbi:MAG: IMP dehydrogenase, partial [Nanoarchaeota archaeon]
MKRALSYNNIILIPKRGILSSRQLADVSYNFLGKKYKLPIILANMKCVINFELAKWLSNNGFFYILHRFYNYDDIFNWIKNNQNLSLISISVGVKQKDKDLIDKIYKHKLKVDVITIDISHGFSDLMEEMIKKIKSSLNCKIISGNIWGDKSSVTSLERWGADALKIGLSYGKSCITFNKTRIASPMFSCGLEAKKWTKLPLIGDGSIRENGDIVLGLRAGYDMIMIGSVFAACKDSPSEYIEDRNIKLFYGSASLHNKGYNKYIEGRLVELSCNNMTIKEI